MTPESFSVCNQRLLDFKCVLPSMEQRSTPDSGKKHPVWKPRRLQSCIPKQTQHTQQLKPYLAPNSINSFQLLQF